MQAKNPIATRLSRRAFFLVASLALHATTAHALTLQGLGPYRTYEYGVSADGTFVVGRSHVYFDFLEGDAAVRWDRDGGKDILIYRWLNSPWNTSAATGVSADGSVVVGWNSVVVDWRTNPPSTLRGAFRWTSGGYAVDLGDLPGGIYDSAANGVSGDGSVVVGISQSANGSEAFRWTIEDGMVGLGDLPGGVFESGANRVSADGSVVVGIGQDENGVEAFRWTIEDGMVGLGDLTGGVFESAANGVSADGSVVVGVSQSENGAEAFRWTMESGMVGLGFNLDGYSEAIDISADGSIIVGNSSAGPFVWTAESGAQSLEGLLLASGIDLTGWDLWTITAISGDGSTIIGTGLNPYESSEGWIIRDFQVVPEPGTWALLLGGGLWMLLILWLSPMALFPRAAASPLQTISQNGARKSRSHASADGARA